MTQVAARTVNRSMVSPTLFNRLVRRIVADEGLTTELAARIMDQALGFLGACAHDHDEQFAPSHLVDIGWHTFILHTEDYASFCQRVAGRFLHHTPTENGDSSANGEPASETLGHTVAAIEAAGFVVDADLWPRGAKCKQTCTGCHNGCHDDPPPVRQ